MHLVVFGHTLSDPWRHRHAAQWHALGRALRRQGHRVTFFEREGPAAPTDPAAWAEHVIYPAWEAAQAAVTRALAGADAAIVTSSCPDALAARDRVLATPGLEARVFYDLDPGLTAAHARAGRHLDWIGVNGLGDYDLVLSLAGGRALTTLADHCGARRVAELAPCADADLCDADADAADWACDLSCCSDFDRDSRARFEALFLEPARRMPRLRFVLGGAGYRPDDPLPPNVYFVGEVPGPARGAFWQSSRLTLHLGGGPLDPSGAPPGWMIEAALCGVAVACEPFPGLERWFEPGREMLVVESADDVIAALERSPEELGRIGSAARRAAIARHSSMQRALELTAHLAAVTAGSGPAIAFRT